MTDLTDAEVVLVVMCELSGQQRSLGVCAVLCLVRGCSSEEAEKLIREKSKPAVVCAAAGVLGRLAATDRLRGREVNAARIIADIAGWDDARAERAIALACHAGYLSSSEMEAPS